MWKKVLAILVCSAIFMVIAGFGVFFLMGPTEEEIAEAQKIVDETYYEIKAEDQNLFSGNMNEEQIQHTIHLMSHQKVKADEKWGMLLLTHARVGKLIEIIEENENKYENSELYLDILNRWYKGDFSKADKDHNAIWELQGGNIGKAKGLLNAIEEKKYISEQE